MPTNEISYDRFIRLIENFFARIDKTETCWLWTGSRDRLGYGKLSVLGSQVKLAHRVAYTLLIASIPPELCLDHVCRNPSCVNPEHLEVVTQRDNVRRSSSSGKLYRKKGHRLIESNLRQYNLKKNGWRRCRTCFLESLRKWKAKNAFLKRLRNF